MVRSEFLSLIKKKNIEQSLQINIPKKYVEKMTKIKSARVKDEVK